MGKIRRKGWVRKRKISFILLNRKEEGRERERKKQLFVSMTENLKYIESQGFA